MTRYYPIYVRRSDGKAETGSAKKREKNEPTPEQLNTKPDANGVSDYYRPIGEDEPKHLDWRRKLGGMLMRVLAKPDSEHQHKAAVLVHLPENFRLFEHIKSRAHDGDPSAKRASKNHAGGGHDRQDAYLYGHPMGRKKRYRSPADFFPHLLWLATDKDGNSDNCSCKICCPEEFQEEREAAVRSTVKRENATPTPAPQSQAGTPAQSPANPRPGHKHPVVVIPVSRPSSSSAPRNVPGQGQQPPQPQSTAPPPVQNPPQSLLQQRLTRLPVLPFPDFEMDMRWNSLLFRPGEVVWHSRGDAWGLGVVIRRYLIASPGHAPQRNYIIQPLSNPLEELPPVHHSEERLLRPWLAWSPPPLTNEILQNRPDTSFHAVDWAAVLAGQFGQGNAEVDGSILAAKAIDVSVTLLHLLSTTRANSQIEERHWGAMFLGAEKIWVGEPVRVKLDVPVQHPILVITEIIEHIDLRRRSNIVVRGDLYSMVTGNVQPNSQMPSFDHLPHRMAQDLVARNQCSLPFNRLSTVNPVKPQLIMPLDAIRGRWYESNVLLPMIQPEAEFVDARRRGTIDDTDPWLNGRGDSSGQQRVVSMRAPERRDALGSAVPPKTRIHDGLEPMSPDEVAAVTAAPQQMQAQQAQQQQQQQQQQIPGATPAGFDAAGFGGMDVDVGEFMNLESDFPTSLPGGAGPNGGMGWG
ncbi:hypothetical protein HDK90DRAFT_413966 [Phyllosticta capitalensis]|uniref:Uncharacterized protein n=1 Tax=Phyllosticta capitalensis TaxID=121624 RepID=A0ABR1YRD9_9PEZI